MKSILVALFGLVLLLLSGCGSQDRYHVVEPLLYREIHEQEFSNISRFPLLYNNKGIYATAEVAGDMHFYGGAGGIYKETESGYEPLPIFPRNVVRDMVAGPDGNLWVTDNFAQIYSMQDGQWVYEVNLNIPAGFVKGMLFDNQDRLFVYGGSGGLWCRKPSGEWSQETLPDFIHLIDGWSDFGQDPVFIDLDSRVVTEGEDGWEISDSLWEGPSSHYPQIQGNPQGWLVVHCSDWPILYLDYGDGWQEMSFTTAVNHVFWLGDELYGTHSNKEDLFHWSGIDWEPLLSFPWTNSMSCFNSLPTDQGQQLFFNNGASLLFDGSSLTVESPSLGRLYGLASFEDSYHSILSNGHHYRDAGDGVWAEVGVPSPDDGLVVSHHSVLVDDQDQLVFFFQNKIQIWTGESSYQEIPLGQTIGEIYPQPDGRVVVVNNYEIGLWAGGSFRWLGEHHEDGNDIQSCQLGAEDNIWVATRHHVRLLEAEQSHITLTFQGWNCYASVWAEQWGLACSGSGHLIVVDGSKVYNRTPSWRGDTDWSPAEVTSMAVDRLGGLLAYENNRGSLLRFDGDHWSNQTIDDMWMIDYGVIFVDNRDGTFFLHDSDIVLLIELEGSQ